LSLLLLGNFQLARGLFDEIVFFIVDHIQHYQKDRNEFVAVSHLIFQNSLPNGVTVFNSSNMRILEVESLQEKREGVDDEEYSRSWSQAEDQMSSPLNSGEMQYQFEYPGKAMLVNLANHNQ